MKTIVTIASVVLLVSSFIASADDKARNIYNAMKNLQGDWIFAPESMQEGKATQHKLVAPLLGTETVAMSFKTIGKGSTVQENLLPGNKKEMVTMYHCKDAECSQVKATHYCVKQNQPEMLVNLSSTDTKLIYNCDMSTPLCQSKQNHVHKITHDLSDNGNNLITMYTTFIDGKYVKDSIYHFVRKQ